MGTVANDLNNLCTKINELSWRLNSVAFIFIHVYPWLQDLERKPFISYICNIKERMFK